METLGVLILTGNEDKNLAKCLRSFEGIPAHFYIVDCFSDDRTVEIAKSFGAKVVQRAWTTYADQFNWGLDNAGIDSDWVMRMDADEELTRGLVNALRQFLNNPPEGVAGAYVRRRVYFMGRWIRHGGYYPTWLVRLFRNGQGRCEALFMDEHIVVNGGTVIKFSEDIIDKNNKDLTFWIDKHNKYATREMLDILNKQAGQMAEELGNITVSASLGGGQDSSKRWIKDNVYLRLPLFLRPFLYFVYRYFIRLGILDGREGLIFHFLQAFWYRFLVDAKLYEHRAKQRQAADS